MRPSNFIACLLLPALVVSCIKDDYEDCEPEVPPTLWKHTVSVKDKNYFNGAQFGDPIVVMDETLPFSSYVGSLTLWRHNAAKADYQVYNATPEPTGEVYDLSVESYPAGINRITATGNGAVFSQNSGQSSVAITLHPEKREHNDIYIGTGNVPMPPTANVDIGMHRAKGALVVFVENIPGSADSLYITTDNLYATIDWAMTYSGSTSVTKGFKVAGTDLTAIIKLAPTVEAGSSKVSLTLVDGDGGRKSHDVTSITMHRNEVSGIRERIDPDAEHGHVVHVYVNGTWEHVVPLEIIPR